SLQCDSISDAPASHQASIESSSMTSPIGIEDRAPQEGGPLTQQEMHSEVQLLQGQLAQGQRREAQLIAQLAVAKLDNESSRTARLAALNLMEDAISSRRAEQQQNA